MGKLLLVLSVLLMACWPGSAGRFNHEQQLLADGTIKHPPATVLQRPNRGSCTPDDKVDYVDGDDPCIHAHWALLVAGSAGWGNYRHQADVYHAYQVLKAGGYKPEHIVVMAYDDIANNPENPIPGKVFNRPGGPDVYSGVPIDYSGENVTAETFLAVLEGTRLSVVNKGSGRVIASGPQDKVFVFYSDHGAAGVVGMPSGPFLYADALMKTVRRKYHHRGFKEMVLYIEACESGSMFEGMMDDDLATYVITAANAYESSWATYCPEFFTQPGWDRSSAAASTRGNGQLVASRGSSKASTGIDSSSDSSCVSTGLQWWYGFLHKVRHYLTGAFGTASSSGSQSHQPASSAAALEPPPVPKFTTCLGDLFSVSWMEDAEMSDLTRETLQDQYKLVKQRTSQNFTYEQGSHVMQYGALEIDEELAGDYEGMQHNGSSPPSPIPTADWVVHEQKQQQVQQQQHWQRHLHAHSFSSSRSMQGGLHDPLQQYSSAETVAARVAGSKGTLEQRDADLLPLVYASKHSKCPRKRAAAAAALYQATSARQSLEATVRSAVASLVKNPAAGHLMLAQLAGINQQSSEPQISQQQPQQVVLAAARGNANGSMGVVGDVNGKLVEMLLAQLPGRERQPLVDSWDCLRDMVQAWESQCGKLDQYGMKYTRLFANLCNAGVQPGTLHDRLMEGLCSK